MPLNKIQQQMLDQQVQDKLNAVGNKADLATTNKTDLVAAINENTSLLAEIAHLFVDQFKLAEEETYDNAIGRAIASVGSNEPVKLTFPRGTVKLNAVVTRKANLTISAYGTKFVPTNNTQFMWTHYGDFFKVEGCEVAGEIVDTHRGFKVLNDVTTKLSSYANFKDIVMTDIFQAIDIYCESGLGGASYRHKFNNVRIRNYTQPKTRVGSFGLRLGGNVEGDAAGNDTKLYDVFIKGYEKNLIVQKSVGTKLTACGLDGGSIAIEMDGGSHLTLSQCYVEYNDTFVKAVNEPYRIMLMGSTVANYTTYKDGNLYYGEEIIDYSTSSPVAMRQKRTFNGVDYILSRTLAGHGSGLRHDNDGKTYDFMKVGTKYSLVPTEDIDLYEHIPAGKKKYFGSVLSTRFSTFDEFGVFRYDTMAPVNGIVTLPANGTHPDVGRNPILMTANTATTTIIRFDYGIVGQRMNLIINDGFTTIAHNANIKLKGKANKTAVTDDTFEFICTSAPTDTTCVWHEV